MKLMSKLTALVIITSFIFVACEDEKEEEVVSASIHAKVMFMNYVAGSDATMIMAYLWEGSDWSTASAGGTVANAMFSVSVSDTLNTMSEAEFEDLPAGTYYMGVFETSGMMYNADDPALKAAGYYNTTEEDYNHMMTPTGIEVSESMDYDLETMMLMSM